LTALAFDSPTTWQATARSARGTSHQRTGAPNQDSGRTAVVRDGSAVVLAVADGHGDPLHARSDRGSRFAVEAAIELLTGWITAKPGSDDAIYSSAAELPQKLVDAWRAKVASDLDADPPRHQAAQLASSRNAELIEQSPEILYGSTLVAAAIDGRLALYVQIGDGDLLTLAPDGAVRRAVPASGDLPLHITESLCQADARDRFRVQVEFFAKRPLPALVMASTDGYSNSFRDDTAFLKVASDLKAYLERNGIEWIAQHLEGWLDETSKNGSGDDITLAMAWLANREKRRRRPLPLLLVIAAVLVLLVPIGWGAWTLAPAGFREQAQEIWQRLSGNAQPEPTSEPDYTK